MQEMTNKQQENLIVAAGIDVDVVNFSKTLFHVRCAWRRCTARYDPYTGKWRYKDNGVMVNKKGGVHALIKWVDGGD